MLQGYVRMVLSPDLCMYTRTMAMHMEPSDPVAKPVMKGRSRTYLHASP